MMRLIWIARCAFIFRMEQRRYARTLIPSWRSAWQHGSALALDRKDFDGRIMTPREAFEIDRSYWDQ